MGISIWDSPNMSFNERNECKTKIWPFCTKAFSQSVSQLGTFWVFLPKMVQIFLALPRLSFPIPYFLNSKAICYLFPGLKYKKCRFSMLSQTSGPLCMSFPERTIKGPIFYATGHRLQRCPVNFSLSLLLLSFRGTKKKFCTEGWSWTSTQRASSLFLHLSHLLVCLKNDAFSSFWP